VKQQQRQIENCGKSSPDPKKEKNEEIISILLD
jgi:hypothetical protein